MKKRGMSLLLVILLLMAHIPLAFAVVASGTCGDNLTWTLDDSGTLTISGTGAMDNYDGAVIGWENEPWASYRNTISTIVINHGVTNLGHYAFFDFENLKDIAIPDSVTNIGDWTFANCGMSSITIPNNVISLGRGALGNCSYLCDITLSNSLVSIGENAFQSSQLISITIPDSVTFIAKEAFVHCEHLQEVQLSNNIYSLEQNLFAGCYRLKHVTIPSSVTNLEQLVFQSCYQLLDIEIPDSITSISTCLFYNCTGLNSVTIPSSVISIEDSAFQGCVNLRDIYYDGTRQQWGEIKIGYRNDNLKNATIHYNDSEPEVEPVTPLEPVAPTPVEPAPQANNDISKYSYAFGNDAKSFGYRAGYKIPLTSFQLIFGKTALAKQKCEQAFSESQSWEGSCYGISATAGMFASSANGVSASAFRNGATRPGELQVSDVNAEWGLTLTQFIEAMQISQYSSMTAIASLQNKNRLSALISAVSAFENGGGGPVLICVYGPDRNGNYAGHALLAYHLDGQQLYVYDSNYPNDGNRAITISDANWSYAISDGVTWNNSNGEITYIPYETYLSDWINRGHVQGTTYVSLVANVADATVRDSAGNEVAAFKKGKMVKGAEKAYPFTHIGITADGVSTAPPQVAVWLPVDDVYTVRNQDASKTRCKISLCNVNQGVSVETTSATVKLSAEDSTSMNFAAIEDIGCEYAITQMSGQNEVKFQGKTARDKVHALLENGVSSGSGITASTNISINGQTVSASDFMNGRTVSVSTVSPHFTDVSPGQYFYDPVMWAVGRGITNGTTATTFSPQNTCSRNHILTFLWRANGSPTAAIGNPFTDVNPDTTFGKAALWAAEKGLVSGTRFNGDNPCTRAEAVTYLWKLAGRPAAGRSAFTDVPSNADYAQAVSWAVERGITKGTSDTTFEPSKICTRGQIVTFLYRTYVEN